MRAKEPQPPGSDPELPPLTLPSEEMRRLGYRVVHELIAHLETQGSHRVSTVRTRAEMDSVLGPLSDEPAPVDEVMRLVRGEVLEAISQVDHPRHFAFVPGSGNFVGTLADTLAARAFLRAHQDHIAVHKLRTNKALTGADLAELERMLGESGVGGEDDLTRAKQESAGLGLFVRSLVGLDRGAAKEALAGFLAGKTLSANQIQFVDMIIDHLTEHGVMDAALLYESPFIDLTPQGPEGLFTLPQVDELVAVLDRVRSTALAA